jgi:hypothetical protein
MSAQNEVALGAHTYTVRPQKLGYLIHKLGPNLQEALTAEIDGLDGAELAGAKARDVLAVFIPDLMPVWEWLGFASEEAMKAKVYDSERDHSPEPLQVKMAFKAASNVNGGEVFGHLKALIGPVLWEKLTALLVAKVAEESGPLSKISPTSAPLPTSPPASGASDPTPSGTTPQTMTPPASAA